MWASTAHAACDVTVSIWDLYSVHPWPRMPSRTNYCGKAEATTCPPRACWWAARWANTERWKSAGSRPVIWAATADVWGHKCEHRSEQRDICWGDIHPHGANGAVRGPRSETACGSETCFSTKRQILRVSHMHEVSKKTIMSLQQHFKHVMLKLKYWLWRLPKVINRLLILWQRWQINWFY